MTIEDIYNILVQQNMISSRPVTPPSIRPSPGQSIKYVKGRRGGSVARRNLQRTLTNTTERSHTDDNKNSNDNHHHVPIGQFIAPKEYEITWDPEVVRNYMQNWEAKGYLKLRAEKLKWSPFLLVRAGAEGEFGVVKKTEAKEAVETGEFIGDNRLTALTTNGLSIEEGSASRGTDTPLSLFDDDNVVNAAEMDASHLSKSSAQSPQSTSSEKPPLNGRRRLLSKRNSTPERGLSPSPRHRRKRANVSTATCGTGDVIAQEDSSVEILVPQLVPTRNLEPSSTLEALDASNKIHQEDVLDDPSEIDNLAGADMPVGPSTLQRISKMSKQNEKYIKDEIDNGSERKEGNVRLDEKSVEAEESAVEVRHWDPQRKCSPADCMDIEEAIEAEVLPGRRSTSRSSRQVSTLVKRVTRQSSKHSSVDEELMQLEGTELVPATRPRQLRNRAVAVASDDSGDFSAGPVPDELQVNGRKPGKPQQRKQVDSVPEHNMHSESPVSVSDPSTTDSMEDLFGDGDASFEGSDSVEATAATSLLSLLHSKPVVFAALNGDATVDMKIASQSKELPDYDVKVEDTDAGSRHSIPSDITVFGSDTQSVRVATKDDERVDVEMVDAQGGEDGDLDADGSVDDGEYDIDENVDADS